MWNNPRPRRLILSFLRGLALVFASATVLFAIVCLLVVLQGRRDETREAGTAIVLGAAQWNGDPSPVLRARLNHALELYRRGTVRRVILTGGVGAGDTVSEAAAGRDYLIERGVAADDILLEEQGLTTWESLNNAATLTRSGGIAAVLLVSDSYHMLRALKMAGDLGLNAYPSPTRASLDAQPTIEGAAHVLREAGAYLVYVFARQ